MKYRSVAVLLALCLSAGSLLAASQEDSKQTAKGEGVRAAVDEKGQLRPPSAEEVRALEALAARFGFDKPLKAVAHGDGAVTMGLDERYDHTYIVTTDENGNLVFSCIDDPAVAHAVVHKVESILRLRPETKTRATEKE